MIRLGMLISFLGMVVMFLGGFASVAIFVYGLYALFAETSGVAFKAIGVAVVLGIVVRIVSGVLMAGGAAMSARAAESAVRREGSQG